MPAAAVNINPHSVIRRVEVCINSPWVGTGLFFLTKHFTPAFKLQGIVPVLIKTGFAKKHGRQLRV
jgi:hypothetical protein